MGTESEHDDLREQFGPAGPEPDAPEAEAEAVEPEAEPEPEAEEPVPAAEEVDPGPPTEPVVMGDEPADEPTAPVPPSREVVVEEPLVPAGPPVPPSRVQAALAFALFALFFVPWFDTSNFFRSSGAGLVAWTDEFITDLPDGAFEQQMLVPYLAVLIPIGAVAVFVVAMRGRTARGLAIVTGLVAPLLLVYLVARAGGDAFRVLDVGAYLTVACSLALLATGFGLLASRRGLMTLAVGTAALVLAALLIPAAANDEVDSELFTAYAANRTSLEPPPTSTTTTSTTLVVTPSTVITATTTTVAPTTTTQADPAAVSSGCPTTGPTSALEVFRFDQQAPGSSEYYVDVRGTTQNRTGASIMVSSIEISVRRDGIEVGQVSIPVNGPLGSGQVLDWFRDDGIVSSPGSPPNAAVVAAVPYSWSDARFASCGRP